MTQGHGEREGTSMNRIRMTALAVLLAWGAPVGAQDKARTFRFSAGDAGKVPAGWQATQTNEGKGSAWKVVADDTAPSKSGFVLAQVGTAPGKVFNLCVATDTSYRDVELLVDFKAVAGDKDQGGGLVWRYQDANNYYFVRMNPLEDNFRLYKVVDGARKQLATKEEVKIPTGQWHHLKVKHVGDQIECFLDGKKLLDVRDETFAKAGRIGLWTKADARTRFDNLRVGAPRRKR
jgi:hypothetical protein